MLIVHKIASWFLKRRIEQIEQFTRYPHETQTAHFQHLIHRSHLTSWGRKHGYETNMKVDEFRNRVPISTYEQMYPYIERMLKGESNVLWPGKVEWFAKSSGTTNDKSKFIPVTEESLDECHYRAGQDLLSLYFHVNPQSKMFSGKTLSIGGSHTINKLNEHSRFGDLSAVIVENLPAFYQLMRTPSKEVALMDNWEMKIEAIADEVMNKDVTSMAGVPTWTLILLHRILEKKGIKSGDLREVWPNMELYLHGGVKFDPYREQFKEIIPHDDMNYMDVYNASEGFFAVQDDLNSPDMLLMLDYGIFYEFIPVENLDQEHPKTHTLDEVELGRNYAMLISTNGGLWRYLIGDTVAFTSRYPYKIRITGRTKHFINAFGEEVVVENAETALQEACKQTGATIGDYTAGPIYLEGKNQGGHEWLIEFVNQPSDLNMFTSILDKTLQKVNTDYQAKRSHDIALKSPTVHNLPEGTFYGWMAKRGKLGGQHKVPRLANHREYIEDILEMIG